mmetsp:Transcript_97242/g.208603  ORF Transcript_97242/g.208603 Transcript_97242/m.208603 type:complete len:314 (+) Transcript_97242:30-971(+)
MLRRLLCAFVPPLACPLRQAMAAAVGNGVASHEKSEAAASVAVLRGLIDEVAAGLAVEVRCRLVADDARLPEEATAGVTTKIVHFIRHGEGYHNVAQREWRGSPDWDGKSEPYTIDNDPAPHRYLDPELTATGIEQAVALRPRAADVMKASPPLGLLVVSPMRRATQTGLLAFEEHISGGAGGLAVLANELCHETAGRHTCDKRLGKSALAAAFPPVDYSAIETEEDPFWSDWERESLAQLARRAGRFAEWLKDRPEPRIAVAAHSGFLNAFLNAAVRVEGPDVDAVRMWFATGEMRTVLLTFVEKRSWCSLL